MDYLTIDQAREADGLRLILTAGVPGPWSESAKQVFAYKHIAFLPVAQQLFGENAELLDWVGVRNAPVAVYPGEAPKTGWREILALAEQLAPQPALLPADAEARADVLALSDAICGRDGFGWNRRLTLFVASGVGGADASDLQRSYGLEAEAAARAPARTAAILRQLAERLHRQYAAGRRAFVGGGITACDLYWACFSLMVRPVRRDWARIPDFVHDLYAQLPSEIADALDDLLIEHRDHVFETYVRLPLDF
jgi:glutathione S-transferase